MGVGESRMPWKEGSDLMVDRSVHFCSVRQSCVACVEGRPLPGVVLTRACMGMDRGVGCCRAGSMGER
jgi:hypothetical protein